MPWDILHPTAQPPVPANGTSGTVVHFLANALAVEGQPQLIPDPLGPGRGRSAGTEFKHHQDRLLCLAPLSRLGQAMPKDETDVRRVLRPRDEGAERFGDFETVQFINGSSVPLPPHAQSFGTFDQNPQTIIEERLQALWAAPLGSEPYSPSHGSLAVEFRWWVHAAALQTGFDTPLQTGSLPLTFAELLKLREPHDLPVHQPVAESWEFFPSSWYWYFCRQQNLSAYQRLLLGMATAARRSPPATESDLRRPAAWDYPAKWARVLWAPALASDVRFAAVALSDRRLRQRFLDSAAHRNPGAATNPGAEWLAHTWLLMVLAVMVVLLALVSVWGWYF